MGRIFHQGSNAAEPGFRSQHVGLIDTNARALCGKL